MLVVDRDPVPEPPLPVGALDGRLRLVTVPSGSPGSGFASAVREGLGAARKSLPCRFLYDTAGSLLFERICDLPEYYPTRTEAAILAGAAPEIAAAAGEAGRTLVELGSGSSRKTSLLLEALLARHDRVDYAPIDVSERVLEAAARGLVARYPRLAVTAVAGDYDEALPRLPLPAGPRLVAFLGSSIGNLEREEAAALLGRAARAAGPSGRLLVGFDRLKERSVLERAYDDGEKVTAAFNGNLLGRINRELGGSFDLSSFAHAAPFVPERSRVEMHLVSRVRQEVAVAALGRSFRFDEGETIHTESCHKYDAASIAAVCAAAGLSVERLWSDPLDWFSVALLAPRGEDR